MGKSKIEWTEATWNPVTGCTEISPGCKNCYAKGMAKRLKAMGQHKYRNEFKVTTHPECLDEPLKWKKPRRIFVCSMGDLLHEDVPDEFRNEMFDVIRLKADWHTYIILTKRPERALAFTERLGWKPWPNNIWLGVTAENQERFDERWRHLKNIPAAVKFVSYEPGLGSLMLPADFLELGKRAWVICGGESGSGARPLHPDWVRSLRDQCEKADVKFFFKQWGEWQISSAENGHYDCDMTRNGAVWVHNDASITTPSSHRDKEGTEPYAMIRIGKKKAGRMLDGVIHDAMPEVG